MQAYSLTIIQLELLTVTRRARVGGQGEVHLLLDPKGGRELSDIAGALF